MVTLEDIENAHSKIKPYIRRTPSIQAGTLVELPAANSVADTLSARKVGVLTLAICRSVVDRIVLVDDGDMIKSISRLWGECNLLVEPLASACLAALVEGKAGVPEGSRVGLVISGGNIDAHCAIDRYR